MMDNNAHKLFLWTRFQILLG